MMRHGPWPRTGAALVLFALVLPSVAHGQGRTPSAQTPGLSKGLDPGSTVAFDMTRGRFLQPLPFDVQFFVQSPVTDSVTRVTGTYARTCDEAVSQGPASATLSQGVFVMTGNPATRHVELSVPALSPNRQYCFVFTLALKPDETRLRAIVAAQLDRHLQDLDGTEASLSTEARFDRFRGDLLDGIRESARAMEVETGLRLRLTVPPDSFFAPPPSPPPAPGAPSDARPPVVQRPGTPSSAIGRAERVEFARLLLAQTGRSDSLEAFNRFRTLAVAELARLRDMPDFVRVVGQLRANLSQPLVAIRMPNDSALRFEAQPRDVDVALASGIAPEERATAININNVWDPEQFNSRVSNLAATIAQLQTFRQILADLATPVLQPLRDAAGLGPTLQSGAPNPNAMTADQITAVAQQVERVRVAIETARFQLINVQDLLRTRAADITAFASRFAAELVDVIEVDGDTTATWDTRARSYVSADVGVAWSKPIDSFFFYVGANFYFGPVNKKAPLRWSDPGNFRKRVALMAAIPINAFDETQTVNTLSSSGVTLKGVLGDRPILLGAGLRLNDLVRASGGAVFFRVQNPNPLIATDRVDYSWFVAFSIDWDLRGMFAALGPSMPPAPSRLRR